MQFMLDVYSSFSLNDKTSQTQQQESSRNHILLASRLGSVVFRVSTLNGGPTRVVQHGPVFRVMAKTGSRKAPVGVILE